jgi:hypothetical protein
MWYSRFESWGKDTVGDHKHYYNIKYAESTDGINIGTDLNNICIDFKDKKYEYAIAKPSVLKLIRKVLHVVFIPGGIICYRFCSF